MSECEKSIVDLLNNPSIAAFIGAFSAFFLVALTDFRRKYSKKKLLVKRVKVLKEIALALSETAQSNIDMINKNRFTIAPIMKFPSDLSIMQREALNVLSSTQINAIDALIYWMKSIDGIFERARIVAENLSELTQKDAPEEKRIQKSLDLKEEYRLAKINIDHFIELASMYINKEPEKIMEYKVVHSD